MKVEASRSLRACDWNWYIIISAVFFWSEQVITYHISLDSVGGDCTPLDSWSDLYIKEWEELLAAIFDDYRPHKRYRNISVSRMERKSVGTIDHRGQLVPGT